MILDFRTRKQEILPKSSNIKILFYKEDHWSRICAYDKWLSSILSIFYLFWSTQSAIVCHLVRAREQTYSCNHNLRYLKYFKRFCTYYLHLTCQRRFHNSLQWPSKCPTNTPHVFHLETTWKGLFPRRFNVKYTWCVCGVVLSQFSLTKNFGKTFCTV